jgi:energy-coupling factor transporter ATP-binding protein EcfA2
MIEKVHFRSFKSIEDVEFEPGRVNVLIGANGSGKSNLLEALGVLSAAVSGRVDDEALLRRGVRPGVPALYKCSFPKLAAYHIFFGAWSDSASYEVSLFNPIKDPSPAWRYKTENLKKNNASLVSRSIIDNRKLNPEAGLVASRMAEIRDRDAIQLLDNLRDFSIYTPDTQTLRGIAPDTQQRQPIGLAGGQLANAILTMVGQRKSLHFKDRDRNIMGYQLKIWAFLRKVHNDALSLIDWAKTYGTASASDMPLSPSIGSTERVIRFKDRFMKSGRDTLSGYDASEGALYILFHAALAAHPKSPPICAVDNADHGLNPRLARGLLSKICEWHLSSPYSRQIFLTTQNPLSLDGLPLQNDQVRLFTVSRTAKGRTVVKRIVLDDRLKKMAEKDWTLSRLWVMGHLGGVPNV